jgi:protease I
MGKKPERNFRLFFVGNPKIKHGPSGTELVSNHVNTHFMAQDSNRKLRVAILTENGFEQSELVNPKETLERAGCTVEIISPQREGVKGWDHDHWGIELSVDRHITEVTADDYDALILPGGVLNPDKLRTDIDSVEFIKDFFNSGKVIAAICHGPQTLIEAKIVDGRRMTSYPSIKKDLVNAGASWSDEEVVDDRGLITSRRPADLPAFNQKIIEALGLAHKEPGRVGIK